MKNICSYCAFMLMLVLASCASNDLEIVLINQSERPVTDILLSYPGGSEFKGTLPQRGDNIRFRGKYLNIAGSDSTHISMSYRLGGAVKHLDLVAADETDHAKPMKVVFINDTLTLINQ